MENILEINITQVGWLIDCPIHIEPINQSTERTNVWTTTLWHCTVFHYLRGSFSAKIKYFLKIITVWFGSDAKRNDKKSQLIFQSLLEFKLYRYSR